MVTRFRQRGILLFSKSILPITVRSEEPDPDGTSWATEEPEG